MDLNISSNGGNASAITGYDPRTRKQKTYGNFADSNKLTVKSPSKRQIAKARQGGKGRPLGYKQNLG